MREKIREKRKSHRCLEAGKLENKVKLRKYLRKVDAFNNHDVEAIVSLYHDNATNHQVTNEPVTGLDAIREMFTTEFATADMTAIVENIFEDGQWAILEWKDPLGLRGCGFFQVVNGKILFQRGYWDKLSFLKQHNLPIE